MRNGMVKGKGLGNILVLGLITALLFTACAPGSPVEEKKVVEIGLIGPFTGAAASGTQVALSCQVDGTAYFNEERGIPGVTLKIIWADTALDRARVLSAYQRFVDRDVVVLVMLDSPDPVKSRAEKDEMPMLALAITEGTMYPPGWSYSCFPTEAERFAVAADWIMENWKEGRPPRIGFVTSDREYGRDPVQQGEKYAKSIGMEWLPPEFVPFVPLDATTQLLRLSDREADFIYVGPIWTTAMPILRDAERLGLMDKIDFCGWDATLTRGVVEVMGPSLEGYFAPRTYPTWNEMENPGIRWANEVWLRYHGPGVMDDMYEGSIHHSTIVPEAIRRAIEKVGYENLDGRAVKEALETIEGFDPYGFGPKITYTNPEERRGSSWVRIYQVQGGEPVPMTDWREAPMLVP